MSGPLRRYQILQAVGKGGFGTVYRARVTGEGGFTKDVALKLVNPGVQDGELLARQRDEARLLGLIRHRAILQVDGLVRLGGRWAVVMEYVDGANVSQLLRAGEIPPSCLVALAAEVASALHVAHTATDTDGRPLGLVHRDVKPSNVQVTRAGEVKLLDFGVARAEFDTREAETVGVVLGTWRYMAPERLDGLDSAAGDVYALGILMVEALTREPMEKTSASEERHAATVALARSRMADALGPEHPLIPLVERTLAYDPAARPTAHALEAELWQAGAGLRAPRLGEWAPGAVARAQDLARRSIDGNGLEGTVLTEQSESMMAGRSEARPRRRAGWLVAALAGLLLVGVGMATATLLGFSGVGVGLAAAGLAAFEWWPVAEVAAPAAAPDPGAAPVPAEPPPAEVPAAGADGAAPDAAPPAPGPVAPQAPPSKAEPTPTPSASSPAPSAPSPAPSAPTPNAPSPGPVASGAAGTVTVVGEVDALELVGPAGRFGPGAVPEGVYAATARFGDRVVALGEVHVRPGQVLTWRCNRQMVLCRAG